MKLLNALTLSVFFLLGSATPQAQLSEPREAQSVAPWAHESSDIPVDPRIHFGAFESGLRFAWANNAEPQERVYVRLHVDAGSLAETDAEQGMAHFLEHMAFNGSKNFEAGTLIEWFQEHGMSFGADTNAHTSFSETVYKLDLPNRDPQTLREGLTVLRDYADGLLLTEEEVQREKGVIDGEERERDSAGFRILRKLLDKMYAGTLFPVRLPIGTKEARDAFNAEDVRAFYTRWYRPENMTLVVVGDLRDFDPVPLMREVFGDMTGPGTPVAPEPAHGTPTMEELNFTIFDAELPSARLSMAMMRPFVERADTIEQRRKDLARGLAYRMLDLRFSEQIKKPDTPYLSAKVSSAGGLEVFEGGDLTVESEPEFWEQALAAGIIELRLALEFGFQEAELEEVRAGMQRSLDEAVEREPTASSAALREAILLAIEEDVVPTDAKTDRDILGPALEALTTADCLAALREDWASGSLSFTSSGALELEDAEEAFSRVHATANAVELEAPTTTEAASFAYACDPERAGQVKSKRHVEDLDVWLVEYENGVKLNLKATDFKERQIMLRARIGSGKLGLEPAQLVACELADSAFSGGGLEAHSADDLRRLLAGKQVGVSLSIKDDALEFSGGATAEDLLLELELLCAYIEHPGYRPDALTVIRAQLPMVYERYAHTPDGPIAFEFMPAFLKGNPRASVFGMAAAASLEELLAVDMASVRDVLQVQLASAPVEVTLVGDFDVEQAIALGARTLGALPARAKPLELSAARKGAELTSGMEMRREIDTQDAKATVLMFFPTTDGFETQTRRNLFFLGRIVSDRLRLEVRERLGAAYSPFAASEGSRVFEGVGALMIQANGEPDQVEQLVAACKGVASDLVENGIDSEEVKRLSEPLLNQLRDMQRDNGFWLNSLDDAQSDEHALDEFRGLTAFYENLDAEALSSLAARFLAPEKASVMIAVPKSSDPKPQD